jgi:hypothetical protein
MNAYYKENITDSDLCNEKYSIYVLIKNINNLNLKVVLSTQILTPQFCIKYILDTSIESGSENSYIYDKNYILRRQKHITSEEFDKCYMNYVNNVNSINTI